MAVIDEEWVEEDRLWPELRAKILALKICRNRCIAHARDDNASEIVKPVLKMFLTLVANSGSFTEDANDESACFLFLFICAKCH